MPILKSVYFNRFTFSHISPSCLTSLILPGCFFCTFITHVASCPPLHLYFISFESRNGPGADWLDCLCNRPEESTVLTLPMLRLQAPGSPISFLCDCQHCEISPRGCMANTLLTASSSQSKKNIICEITVCIYQLHQDCFGDIADVTWGQKSFKVKVGLFLLLNILTTWCSTLQVSLKCTLVHTTITL